MSSPAERHAARQADHPTETPETPPRAVYERVIRVVDYQTGGLQPPLARETSVRQVAIRDGYPASAVDAALAHAFDRGELFWVRDDGRRYLGIDDADALRAKIASHAQRADDPARGRIGVATRRIDALRGDGE